MTPFLKQVANKYVNDSDVSSLCFIFPNRRSIAFFRKYFAESLAEKSSAASPDAPVRPVVAPEMLTVNDFFLRADGSEVTDRVTLLLNLYDCYRKLNAKAESLDEFVFWGDVILSDFNDTDKYLVSPEQLFTNVTDFRKLQDTYSYLSETQRNAIKSFVSHFNDLSGRLTVDIGSDNPNVKERFLQIWNMLYPLYRDYNSLLSRKGLAYEGMVYRRLAERIASEPVGGILERIFPHSSRYVFVGLNALNECEKTLMRKMRNAGIADFCWDYSGDMIRDVRNRSSFFMSENVKEFPQSMEFDSEGMKVPEIRVVSVPSSVGQVKMVPKIFARLADEFSGGDMSKVGTLGRDGIDCAVVLPDETLLMPLLNSIPPEIMDINVTMGYPMTGSDFYALMSDLSAVQLHTVRRGGVWMFYHKQVWSVFSNSIFRKVADRDTLEAVLRIKREAKYYIPQPDLSCTPLLRLLFEPVIEDPKLADRIQIDRFAGYQAGVLSGVAPGLKEDCDMAVEMEFAKEYYRSVNMLRQVGLEVLPVTYIRLLSQLLGAVSVPFEGEPLKGLQIMGPLETRALDFRNMIIMSSNEGVFPKRNVSSSFVPPELRRGFGMPAYEYQDAVWAYYFYRMIARAENVWMIYDSRTEGLKSGEESRYIKQLQYHFRLPLKRYVAKAELAASSGSDRIEKTEEDIRRISGARLSATAVQNYLVCPAKFYYYTVKGLRPENEVSESIDAGMLGNVYHDTMWALYCGEEAMAASGTMDKTDCEKDRYSPLPRVDVKYIKSWLKREKDIKNKVKSLMCAELSTMEISGRDIVVADVIVKYVMRTLRRDLEQIERSGRDWFEIKGLELPLAGTFCGHEFVGYIDRLDSFADGTLRVVDYKTGKVLETESGEITDDNAEEIAEAIFGKDVKDRPKIAFQFYIYDMLLHQNRISEGHQLLNCVYSMSGLFSEIPATVPENRKFYDTVSERLALLLGEISDISVPFELTEDRTKCEYCDFRMICGR